MARFPKPEAEIVALAQALASGLTANAAIYPAPPVLPAALTTLVSAYTGLFSGQPRMAVR